MRFGTSCEYTDGAMKTKRRITNLLPADRPREKLAAKGARALSDFELLEVVIGNGNASADVSYIARKVQHLLDTGTSSVTHESLLAIKGVGEATANKILAALEVAHRHLMRNSEPILTLHDMLVRLSDIRRKPQEHLICMTLDGGQRLIAQRTITIGTLDTVMAHPREVFADAIADRAATILVAHNHPSGNARPSEKDIDLTQQLAAAGHLLGIELRDHLIVTQGNYFSYRQHHLL